MTDIKINRERGICKDCIHDEVCPYCGAKMDGGRPMTIEIKQLHATAPYLLSGVQKITDKTEYGDGYFAITIFDRRIFVASCFEYVKNVEKGKYYVKMGKWVGEEE